MRRIEVAQNGVLVVAQLCGPHSHMADSSNQYPYSCFYISTVFSLGWIYSEMSSPEVISYYQRKLGFRTAYEIFDIPYLNSRKVNFHFFLCLVSFIPHLKAIEAHLNVKFYVIISAPRGQSE